MSHITLCLVWIDVLRAPDPSFNQCRRVQTYLLKLARSGDDGEKVFLVLESGTRFHTTQVLHLYIQSAHQQTPSRCLCCVYIGCRSSAHQQTPSRCLCCNFIYRMQEALHTKKRPHVACVASLYRMQEALHTNKCPRIACVAVGQGQGGDALQLHAEAAEAPEDPAPGGCAPAGSGPHHRLLLWYAAARAATRNNIPSKSYLAKMTKPAMCRLGGGLPPSNPGALCPGGPLPDL